MGGGASATAANMRAYPPQPLRHSWCAHPGPHMHCARPALHHRESPVACFSPRRRARSAEGHMGVPGCPHRQQRRVGTTSARARVSQWPRRRTCRHRGHVEASAIQQQLARIRSPTASISAKRRRGSRQWLRNDLSQTLDRGSRAKAHLRPQTLIVLGQHKGCVMRQLPCRRYR